jgi:hypothetical protein
MLPPLAGASSDRRQLTNSVTIRQDDIVDYITLSVTLCDAIDYRFRSASCCQLARERLRGPTIEKPVALA